MKVCLVLGDARGVREEAAEALALFTPDAVFATNNIGIEWPHVDVWCTLHPGKCHDWVGMEAALVERAKRGLNAPEVWGHQARCGITRKTADWGGSTGLLCVKVAREKLFDRIVLAGVPMSAEAGHYYHPRGRPWASARGFQRNWRKRAPMLAPFVRSMSGFTRELFGVPTIEWLNGEAEGEAA